VILSELKEAANWRGQKGDPAQQAGAFLFCPRIKLNPRAANATNVRKIGNVLDVMLRVFACFNSEVFHPKS
jgi:hypothetical protein